VVQIIFTKISHGGGLVVFQPSMRPEDLRSHHAGDDVSQTIFKLTQPHNCKAFSSIQIGLREERLRIFLPENLPMKSNPALSVVHADVSIPAPPTKLGPAGLALWDTIQSAYKIDDAAGIVLLGQACTTQDRLEKLRVAIDRDGEVIQGPAGPIKHPALSAELAGQAFILRVFEKLGLHFEPIKPMGRPPKTYG
jgi:hypothetical protein